ncbi:hypothetical protein [Bradyrhizobium altum]|uniref:hypothetical protein n=1 Tax=Bradyrhizobium altum TaxID=1571202 RepID=UPI002899F860|nr:hypothetical protein [Bradyrhizobium altum]
MIAAAEIFSILWFLTRTLDGAESALFFPSKMRTFRNRIADSCCACAAGKTAGVIPIAASSAKTPTSPPGILKPDISDLRLSQYPAPDSQSFCEGGGRRYRASLS